MGDDTSGEYKASTKTNGQAWVSGRGRGEPRDFGSVSTLRLGVGGGRGSNPDVARILRGLAARAALNLAEMS